MIIAMIAIGAVVLALCMYMGATQLMRRATPPELRGDWWEDFERQFRAHAAEVARTRDAGRAGRRAKRPPAS